MYPLLLLYFDLFFQLKHYQSIAGLLVSVLMLMLMLVLVLMLLLTDYLHSANAKNKH